MSLLYRLARASAQAFFFLCGGLRFFGTEHIPPAGAFFICANHCSLLDPPALGVAFKYEIGYLAKKELHELPVLRQLLPRLGTIPVDRAHPGKETVRVIMDVLTVGRPIVVFPEGTRSRTAQLGKAKAGIGFLARAAGVPVLPTYIQNTFRWPWTLKRRNRMAIHFGRPIEAEWIARVAPGKAGRQKIADEIINRIRALQQAATGADQTAEQTTTVGTPSQAVDKSNICPSGQI